MIFKKYFIIVIAALTFVTGCSKLDRVDLSGKIELTLSDKEYLYANRLYKHRDYSASDVKNIEDFLLDLIDLHHRSISDFFSDLAFTKQFILGKNKYSVKVQFVGAPPNNSDYLVDILNSQGENVLTTIIKKIIDNDGLSRYESFFDDKSYQLSGFCLLSFTDPSSGIECILKTEYEIEHEPSFVYYNKDGKEITEEASVSLSTTAHIGNRYFLYGERSIDPKKKTGVYVIDTNLDGLFTNEDKVWFKKGPDSYFPFNEEIKIGKFEYIMDLTPKEYESGKYILNVQRKN
ncbi:MAG: hypothetical protein ACM3YE_15355 [Bacteroidota bacterium]